MTLYKCRFSILFLSSFYHPCVYIHTYIYLYFRICMFTCISHFSFFAYFNKIWILLHFIFRLNFVFLADFFLRKFEKKEFIWRFFVCDMAVLQNFRYFLKFPESQDLTLRSYIILIELEFIIAFLNSKPANFYIKYFFSQINKKNSAVSFLSHTWNIFKKHL